MIKEKKNSKILYHFFKRLRNMGISENYVFVLLKVFITSKVFRNLYICPIVKKMNDILSIFISFHSKIASWKEYCLQEICFHLLVCIYFILIIFKFVKVSFLSFLTFAQFACFKRNCIFVFEALDRVGGNMETFYF